MSENTELTRAPRLVFVGTLRLGSKPVPVPAVAPAPVPAVAPPPVRRRRQTPPLTSEVEERIAQRVADLTLCRDRFPALFDLDLPLPLAVGIDKPLGVIIGHDRAAFLLNWWTEWPAYVAAVAAGGCRYRLDGSEAGEISDDHRETAAARIRAARALGQPGKGAP